MGYGSRIEAYIKCVPYKTWPNTLNHLFYFIFFKYEEYDTHCVIAADAENVPQLLEDDHSPFLQRFLQIFEEPASHCLQQLVLFKVLQVSWVVDSFLKKSPRVRSGDCGGQRPRPTMRLSKKSCKKTLVVFEEWRSPHLDETSSPVHSVPAEQWVESKRLCNFHSNCLFREKRSHNSSSRYCTPNTNLWQKQRIIMQCMWVFSTVCSTVLANNVATQVGRCIVRKKQTVQYKNPFF